MDLWAGAGGWGGKGARWNGGAPIGHSCRGSTPLVVCEAPLRTSDADAAAAAASPAEVAAGGNRRVWLGRGSLPCCLIVACLFHLQLPWPQRKDVMYKVKWKRSGMWKWWVEEEECPSCTSKANALFRLIYSSFDRVHRLLLYWIFNFLQNSTSSLSPSLQQAYMKYS